MKSTKNTFRIRGGNLRLRNLEMRDAWLMYSWMHDKSVVGKMQTDFEKKTIDDCRNFIANSQDKKNIHLAIVDNEDVYLGTVSLKHITTESAEFAIVVRKEAMGKGYSIWAMNEIIRIGFEKYRVKKIYWCVARDNFRARRFYDKNGFAKVSVSEINSVDGYSREQIEDYIWYAVISEESHECY
ncbi:MAG: GNAT family N-acetyltransferase [Lachnospiraceae bacterium]|nr:GNAT family N-acetyltransferase [Lachnospiraceae bacterium]